MKFDCQFSNFKDFLFLLSLITQSLSYPFSGWMSYLDSIKKSQYLPNFSVSPVSTIFTFCALTQQIFIFFWVSYYWANLVIYWMYNNAIWYFRASSLWVYFSLYIFLIDDFIFPWSFSNTARSAAHFFFLFSLNIPCVSCRVTPLTLLTFACHLVFLLDSLSGTKFL